MVLSMQRWKGKVAIVTGASSGIGAGIATALVKEGLCVVGLARRVERVQQLAASLSKEPGKLHAIKCDLSKEEDIAAAFEEIKKIGPIHILINNAGKYVDQPLLDGESDVWRSIIDTNLLAPCITTQEAVKDMRANGVDGHVIHICSVGGHYVPPFPNINVYPATKFGIRALTETMRQELVRCKSKIKISCISPGVVDTELTGVDIKDFYTEASFMQPEDIADSVVYVLSTPQHVQVHELLIRAQGETF